MCSNLKEIDTIRAYERKPVVTGNLYAQRAVLSVSTFRCPVLIIIKVSIAAILREESMTEHVARPVEGFSVAMIANFERYPNIRLTIEMIGFELIESFQLSMFELQTGRAAP